jgi:hypothetical protein
MKIIGLMFVPLLLLCNAVFAQPAPTPPAPCGPAEMLGEDFSTNVAADSRCFEIRMYSAQPMEDIKSIDQLHQRFREAEIDIFRRLGADIIGVWQRVDDPNTLVWMLGYRDRAHRDEVWTAFRTDPEWLALLEKYPVPLQIEAFNLSAADYSPMK